MLVLEVMLDVLFGVLFQRLGPMEIAHPLTAGDRNLGITATVDNPNRIPVCLSAVGHKSLELRSRNFMPSHDMIEILPEDDLCIFVLRLEVTACNGHDTLICRVIHMTGHGGLIGNTFDMVEHDPSKLKISARLHLYN